MKQVIVILSSVVCIQMLAQERTSDYSQEFLMCGETGVDAYLASGAPTTNYGNHPTMGGNTWTCNQVLCNSRAVFYFPLPANANYLVGADLILKADTNWGTVPTWGPGNNGWLKRITSNWNEMTVTWANQPPTTTVNQVMIPQSVSLADNYTINITPLVIDMIYAGNFGLMLKLNDEVNFFKSLQFASSDNSSIGLCPKVIFHFGTKPMGIKSYGDAKISHAIYSQADGAFQVQCSAPVSTYKLVDLMGRTVILDAPQAEEFFISSDLVSGTYVLQAFSENGQLMFVEKVMKF